MWCYRFIRRHGFSIRRIGHKGQTIPESFDKLQNSFIEEVIMKKKNLNIPYDDNCTIINMDETPVFLEMGFDTTLEFTGKKNVDILTSGREHYRISIMLAVVGNGYKLPPLLIIKAEPGKTVEKNLRSLPFVREKNMFIYCQEDGWCTTAIFKEWIKVIFQPYEKEYGDKCILIMDKASSHISKESLSFLKENNIEFILIPAGMTPHCQPLDISVNKVFKDNVKLLFEKDRLDYEGVNNQIKLKQAPLNLIDYINRVWSNDQIITKDIIINGFNKAGLINIFYTTSEEDKIRESYNFDIFNDVYELEDDLGKELNVDPNELEEKFCEDENSEEGLDNEKKISN